MQARQLSNDRGANSTATSRRRLAVAGFASGFVIAGIIVYQRGLQELHAETTPSPEEIRFENNKRKKGLSKEENRDLISSQHVQVKQSWENPGVYAWGSNSGRVAAPDSNDSTIKTPRRIAYFDGMLLRDIKLDRTFGAAITENGDLVQWGTGYAEDIQQPTKTLTGKNLSSLAISRDRILALSKSGTIYSLPVAKADQLSGPKPSEFSYWLPYYPFSSSIHYRTIKPQNLSYFESPIAISSGLDHLLILTSSGRLFSAASSSSEFPSHGEMGIPGLTWTTRPEGPYDQPHEISTLKGFEITSISTGDQHSLALDKEGRVFAWGDNSSGQLGLDLNTEAPSISNPSLVPLQRLYNGSGLYPTCTGIFAGGLNSFFTVDASQMLQSPTSQQPSVQKPPPRNKIQADTLAAGAGILGSLGTGRWTHNQTPPRKIKALSGLYEYDEPSSSVVPIRLARLSVGATHASATMANVTHLGAHAGSSKNDTNWGADVLWWGGNEYYQLGTGKRSNVSTPIYIAPMEGEGEGTGRKREEHRFQITPKGKAKVLGKVREVEQRIECGRFVTGVYMGV